MKILQVLSSTSYNLIVILEILKEMWVHQFIFYSKLDTFEVGSKLAKLFLN